MKTSDFSYDLPKELIAQDPAERRDLSRLLVINKNTGKREHKVFHDIIDYLVPGDCLVVNNTKVIPARLLGEREGTGGKVEVLLLKRKGNDIWETLVRPGKKARPGQNLEFGGGLLKAEVLETAEDGNRLVQFNYDGIFEEILDKLGQMPLPPYITHKLKDKNRYQTVYACLLYTTLWRERNRYVTTFQTLYRFFVMLDTRLQYFLQMVLVMPQG